MRPTIAFAAAGLLLALAPDAVAAPKPVKVFILADQFNMEGQGYHWNTNAETAV